MTATVTTSGITTQSDGGGDGKAFTTGTITGTKALIVCVMSSSNSDTITAPGTGTWAEITVADNVIAIAGGQMRMFRCQNPASSTTYTFSLAGGRRTLIWAVLDAMDATNYVDVAVALETAPGASHAPGSATPTAASELCIDFAGHRWFSPDSTGGWTPPASGLTWTEHQDGQGGDTNNNCRLAMGSATAGSSGVAVSTTAWTAADVFEDAIVFRVLVKSATGSSPTGAGSTSAHPVTTGTGSKLVSRTATTTPHPVTQATTTKTGTGTARPTAHAATTAATTKTGTGTATTTARPTVTVTGAQVIGRTGPSTTTARPTTTAVGYKTTTTAHRPTAHATTTAVGLRKATGVGNTTTRPSTAPTGQHKASGVALTTTRPTTTATVPPPPTPTTGALIGVDSTTTTTGHHGGTTTATGTVAAQATSTGAVA